MGAINKHDIAEVMKAFDVRKCRNSGRVSHATGFNDDNLWQFGSIQDAEENISK